MSIKDFYQNIPETDRGIIDTTMLVTTAAAFFDLVPDMAALASLIWVLIRIWETDTVKFITFRGKKGKEDGKETDTL